MRRNSVLASKSQVDRFGANVSSTLLRFSSRNEHKSARMGKALRIAEAKCLLLA
jgi:hypothetical protein